MSLPLVGSLLHADPYFMEPELLRGALPLAAELWHATGKAMYMYTDEACASQSSRCGSAIGR